MIILVLLGFAAIAAIDLIPLIRQRCKPGIIAFSIVFAAALALSVLEVSGVNVPSSMLLIGDFLKSIGLSYPS